MTNIEVVPDTDRDFVMKKYNRRYTPDRISELKENEIFVFGSNLEGSHDGGAAKLAYNRFGAVWGLGTGIQGRSYAIPTMQGGVETIRPYVDAFIQFAKQNTTLTFLVTRIGCGIAGFRDEEIAPLFEDALDLENVILPKEFVENLVATPTTPDANETTWNSTDFISTYEPLMKKVAKGDRIAYYKVKELRVQEYRSTIEIVNQGYYTTEDGKRVTFPTITRMEHETKFYKNEFRVDNIPTNEEETKIIVRNVDCLEEGVRLCREGYNPAILNMASRRHPGGGVMLGAGAQEESLFRRTNLFRSLYQFTEYFINHVWYKKYITPVSTGECYPLDRNFGGIYTPGALLFREDEQHGYKLMESPECLSFISVAGMNRPKIKDATHIADDLIEGTKNKMRTILRIGLRHGHDSLVLGALGCGAYRNPPSHIAKLFHEVFEEPEFKNKYRLISFAILDDHNTHQAQNPEGNYKPFADEFAETGNKKSDPSPEVLKALMMWKMGAGNSAKRFNGENPIPVKTVVATKDSWTIMPMPEQHTTIPVGVILPENAMECVKYGHIPDAMEDHWFMYCDDNTIRYYRSWTGFCIYVAKYEKVDDGYKITDLTVNRYPEQYKCDDDKHDLALFMALLTEEYGGDASLYWNAAF